MFFLALCVTYLASVAHCIGRIFERACFIPASDGQKPTDILVSWDHGNWLDTTGLLSRSCSASLSETPVRSRWFGNAMLSVILPMNEALSRFSYLSDSPISSN
jgi:hypothetical protein